MKVKMSSVSQPTKVIVYLIISMFFCEHSKPGCGAVPLLGKKSQCPLLE